MVKQRSRSLFYIAILIFIALICLLFFLYSSFFYIDKISISGTEKVSESEVLRLSDLAWEQYIGNNRFALEHRDSPCKIAQVSPPARRYKITVEERKQWALMPYQIFLVLDEEGCA